MRTPFLRATAAAMALVFAAGCASTTIIKSIPSCAKVYLDAEVAGRVERPAAEDRPPRHLAGAHAPGGQGGRADPDARGGHGLLGIPRDHVLVHGDAGLAEGLLGDLAVDLNIPCLQAFVEPVASCLDRKSTL